MEDPPYEIKGSGTPVIGIKPMDMPIFSKVCRANQAMTPTQTNLPKRSLVRWAIRKARQKKRPKKANIKPEPTKPVSSPATVKMKSVCCSGTNLPFV